MSRTGMRRTPGLIGLALAWALLAPASPLPAQTTTATITGTVSDEAGVLPGATVTARDAQSGFTSEVVTAADGTFALGGLRPGTYEITVSLEQYKPQTRTVQVLVGQTVTVNFKISPDLLVVEQVQVVADNRLVETKTAEISTNVTQDQIRFLPQSTRNFLNFAALAPGVRVSDDEFRKEIAAGALAANQTNVFIDGVSYKNDVIEGGVIGQDASRGNPFPQNAVQEFQVLTQNYKAEFEKASSAIITAITRSGGNSFSGEVFNLYQDKNLVQNEQMTRVGDRYVVTEIDPKPTYERWQWGASLGGPIVRDRMQFFASYEENRQDRDNLVTRGVVEGAPPELLARLEQHEGVFRSPFREKLLFGKLSAQPRAGQQVEVTYNWRNETDIRGFGNQSSYEAAENVRNRVDSVLGRWQIATAGNWLNETFVSYQRYRWNPVPLNKGLVGLDYQGLMRIGGRDTEQLFVQQRVALRDDLTRFATWRGSHALKAGAVVSFNDYEVRKEFTGNPIFRFRSVENFAFPFEASYGVGDPDLSADNVQFGVFLQDDWAITPRLTLNVGLRWDYESDQLNNDYVTPENVREATARFVDPARYFTDGDDRPPFYGAWQPRLGFSYDISGNGSTVAFGGWGRYYDRVLYNYTLDERFRLQYAVRTFRFSETGEIRDGNETIVWDPSYLSVEGLQGLIDRGVAPNPEVFLIDNETKPPVSDQFSIGVRQRLGPVVMSASYSGVRSHNGFTFLFGNRRADGTCCETIPGFSNILISSDDKKSWYDALYFQAEKPLSGDRFPWGFSLTYTLGRAEQIGGDLFSLDYPTVADYPRYPTSNDERHRVVATAIARVPWDIYLSTLITLGSGTPYTITDESLGAGPNERRVRRNEGRPQQFSFIFPDAWAYRSVDLRAEKQFRIGGMHRISVAIEGVNVFSFDNFTDYDGYIPTLPATNPLFGQPRRLIDPGRRLQVGVRYGF
ncbi:MAG TPA: carboxypeptidase regulatory-like domain-containing protein [Vicinamibacterales bacterium]